VCAGIERHNGVLSNFVHDEAIGHLEDRNPVRIGPVVCKSLKLRSSV